MEKRVKVSKTCDNKLPRLRLRRRPIRANFDSMAEF